MKILILNNLMGGFAGDAAQFMLLAKGLIDLGNEVTIAVPDGDGFYYDKDKSKKYAEIRKKLLDAKGELIEINNVPVLPIHCTSEKYGYYCPDASKIGKEILKDFDIIYCLNWYYHLAMVFSKIAFKYNIPFVISAMGAFEQKAHNLKNTRKKMLDLLYTKKLMKNAAGFHSVGDLETQSYVRLGAIPEKIYRVDHGIMLENFEIKSRTCILEKFGIGANTPYLFFVGRIDPKKGVDVLLQVFEKVTRNNEELLLVITGTGTEEYVKSVKNLSNELGIEKRVIFTGFVSEKEKLELFESAKLHVVTSHSDIHTTTAIESMAMGIPVVITKASDFPEIDEYKAGITVDMDIDSICSAIQELIGDEEKLKQYSENAKTLIQEKFLLKNKIKEYENMFQDIINKFCKDGT